MFHVNYLLPMVWILISRLSIASGLVSVIKNPMTNARRMKLALVRRDITRSASWKQAYLNALIIDLGLIGQKCMGRCPFPVHTSEYLHAAPCRRGWHVCLPALSQMLRLNARRMCGNERITHVLRVRAARGFPPPSRQPTLTTPPNLRTSFLARSSAYILLP